MKKKHFFHAFLFFLNKKNSVLNNFKRMKEVVAIKIRKTYLND